MITGDIVGFLEKVPPFQFLGRSAIEAVARKVSMEFYPKGIEILVQAGTPSKYLYVIQKGGVKVFIRSADEEIAIDYRSEGDLFGFASLYSGDRSRTNVVAIEDTICYLVDKDTFMGLHDGNPIFAEYFIKAYQSKYIDKILGDMYDKGFVYKLGSNLPITTPVGDIASKRLITGSLDITIQEAAKVMVEHKISSLIIVDEKASPAGIVTDRDLREKVVACGTNTTEPIRKIMSASLVCIDARSGCLEALIKMIRYGIHHLPVMEEGELRGMVTNNDLLMLQGASPITIVKKIESQNSIDGLVSVSAEIIKVISMLLKQGAKASSIARAITEINDRLVGKVIELDIIDHGQPPLPFCWIVFGSEGRREQTFKTDQDNALIYADPETKEEEGVASRYFEEFSNRVNDALVRCGFPLCPAGYMASNPRWRQPLKTWKRFFAEWITSSTPKTILLSKIFFDFRPVYGDSNLAEALRNHLVNALREEKLFLARMAATVAEDRPPLGFFKTLVVEKSGEHKDQLNLKVSAIALLVDIIRLFGLERGVRETSTLDRISVLKGRHDIVDEFANELDQSFEFMMLLRMLHQFEQAESGIDPDNFIDPNKLSVLEKQTLKEVFQLISRVQELIAQRHRLGTVS